MRTTRSSGWERSHGMEQKLFTELRWLYTTSREDPCAIRIRIRMRDLVDPGALRNAVDTTMERYPYFCVELQKRDGQYIFAENHRPIAIANSPHGVELNSEHSNFHMVAFSWWDNWIMLDVFHGMTDGTGAYEIVRTMMHYYCSERYRIDLDEEGIRLLGDEISPDEWADHVASRVGLPTPSRFEMPKAMNLVDSADLQNDRQRTVYSIAIAEDEFMEFVAENNGSPATLVSLLFSRAIAKLYPDSTDAIRISLCVDQRNALHAPSAHQSLVGAAFLEYAEEMRDLPVGRQAPIYREAVFAQTREEAVLGGVASQSGISHMILSKDSDSERVEFAAAVGGAAKNVITASVSYVGKADFKEAERYIRDFRLWTTTASNGMTIEMSAVNGRFTLDFLQTFSSPIFVEAFLKELEDNGIEYDLQDVNELELPNVKLPWSG